MKKLVKMIKDFFSNEMDIKEKGIKSKDYGTVDNFIYAVKISLKYNKAYIFALIFGSVALSLYQLMVIVAPKIVLELVDRQVTTQTMVWIMVAFGVAITLLNYISGKAGNIMDYGFDKVQYNLMADYLRKVFYTDFKNMENPDFLDLTERARRATYYNCGFHGYCQRVRFVLNSLTVAVISGAAIIFIHPLIVVTLGILSYLSYRFFENTMQWNKVHFEDAMAGTWRKLTYLQQSTTDFSYAKDIRLFGMSNWIENIWNDVNTVFIKRCKLRHNKWVMCEVKISTLNLIQNAILYSVLIYMVFNKGLSISNFVLYVGLVSGFSQAMFELFSNLVWMHLNKMQMDNYRTFMDWEEEQPDDSKEEGTISNIDMDKYEFVFENVSFKYPGHDDYVLKNVNLKIEAGMKMAVVGINGAGKTTLTKLLMRLYEPTEGRILLNGVDVKKYDRSKYYEIFAPVFQNVEVFAFPIWENISMRERERTDFELVKKTLVQSGLDEKISKYDNGIETQLLKIFDSNGIDLSGGERQRLAMAKALYQNRSVIVLDEPTAALDALAEDRMYQEFNSMVEGKTSIFISHRLSSTRFCDTIVMFEDGQVIEQGTHDELINKDGKYAYMYHVQAQYYQEENDKESQQGGEVCA
ncbi:MAG: ATP-binding cassette domain-containing protein [Lachnospiraceae bacterium]|nr:ATP-binding cassette domain-containing protein [Lachnospiraceae bacterium]